jgi:hypothetical protein
MARNRLKLIKRPKKSRDSKPAGSKPADSKPAGSNSSSLVFNGWQLASLCKVCRKLSWSYGEDFWHNPRDIRGKAHSNQCPVCILIWAALEDPDLEDNRFYLTKVPQTIHYAQRDNNDGIIHVSCYIVMDGIAEESETSISYEQSSQCTWYLAEPNISPIFLVEPCFGYAKLKLSPAANLEPPKPCFHQIEDSTDSTTTTALIKYWLNDCQTLHKTICMPESKRLPTRLLDLIACNPDVDGDSGQPMLVITDGNVPVGMEYLTLSHCWGDPKAAGKFTNLVTTNLETFQKAIPPAALSRTFRDAITVARRLEFRYLWIDSLCIIQDDETDWMRESAMMGEVYAGSTLNIAAAAAVDGNGGLFFKRNPAIVKRCMLMVNGSLHSLSRGTSYEECVINLPLNQRGWIYQERYLSPRTLYFGSSQLFWQCCHYAACETFPEGLPLFEFTGKSPIRDINHRRDTQKIAHLTDLDSNARLSDQWNDVISSYSKGSLTRGTDKLIALSGVAKRFNRRFGGKYLAGMWEDKLLSQLAWTVDSGHCQRPAYRAPSCRY